MADQKIMSRIMKLLERANHPNTPEAERLSCMEKADALMAQHMIDRMDLKPEDKSKIISDKWDLNTGEAGTEFSYHMVSMMENVLTHCGIRVNPKYTYTKDEDGRTNYRTRRYTVVGFPEDMAYAEQIWFRVFKEFVVNVNPKWDTSKPLAENVYHFARAGLAWGDVLKAAWAADPVDHYGIPELLKGGGAKLRKLYQKECERRGEEYSKTRTHSAYRSSFVQSYGGTIAQRLRTMREAAKESVSDAGKFALAIRDTKEQVDEEFYRLFPEYDPEVRRKMREAEEFAAACEWAALTEEEQAKVLKEEAAKEARWARQASRARRNYGSVRERKTYDSAAWARGRDVASKVNLNVDGEVKNRKRGEIQ
jgi:hypothetical protein